MAGNEQETESPVELLRQLIEKSGKWTEESVVYVRTILIQLSLTSVFVLALILRDIMRSLSQGYTPLGLIVAVLAFCLLNVWILPKGYRRYRSHRARRDNWKRRFEVLKKKEEEIEKLLSGEAG